MALDRPEIIDGDLAWDLANEFKDKYDSGADQEELELWAAETYEHSVIDDLEAEIWVSVLAQCFWEVGMLPPEFVQMFDEIIKEKAGVKYWEQSNLGDLRQTELQELRNRISNPNPKPKLREKYSEINEESLIFQPNTVVCFQLNSGQYRAAILVRVDQYRGDCTYQFCASGYEGLKNLLWMT